LLILDLDETLVFASERPLVREPESLVGPYFVYLRPYLHDFLVEMTKYFDLAVWSSSSPDYAHAIVNRVFPLQRKLKFVWGRDRCIQRFDGEWQRPYYVKDLKKVQRQGYDLKRILVVDDTPKKYERHYGNVIYVPEFLGDQTDFVLPRLGKYLASLAETVNVRVVEKRNWMLYY